MIYHNTIRRLKKVTGTLPATSDHSQNTLNFRLTSLRLVAEVEKNSYYNSKIHNPDARSIYFGICFICSSV